MVMEITGTLLSSMKHAMRNLTPSSITTTTPAPDLTEDKMAEPDYPDYYELCPQYVETVKMVCRIHG